MSKEVIYIFIGGGTGSALRYFIQLLMHERIVPYHFPWATFTVNLLGSFPPSVRVPFVSDNGFMWRFHNVLYFLQ